MFCSKCGHSELVPNARICSSCGSTLAGGQSQKVTGTTTCITCGQGGQTLGLPCQRCGASSVSEDLDVTTRMIWTKKRKVIAGLASLAVVTLLVVGFSNGVSPRQPAPSNQVATAPAENSEVSDTDAAALSSGEGPLSKIFEDLQNTGASAWEPDPYSDLASGTEGILLADECALWVFPDLESKRQAIEAGIFDGIGEPYFWWDKDPKWFGVVLVAYSEQSTCAMDAAAVLSWNLADFAP